MANMNWGPLRTRSTSDLLVLMIAGTICGMVVAGGVSIVVVELIHPETDSGKIIVILSDTLNTLIGLLAGFLAGRSENAVAQARIQQLERQLKSEGKEPEEGP